MSQIFPTWTIRPKFEISKLFLVIAAIDSYFHVFNTNSIKKNPATHALKLFLTGKRKLHEVTGQPGSLGFFAFQKSCIWGKESAFKKETRKEL